MRKRDMFDGYNPPQKSQVQRGETTVVYALVDPRDHAVRYIGVTNSVLGRFKEHMRMYGGNERKNAWIRDVLDASMLPLMYTLEVLEEESDWRDREIAWIRTYKEQGADLLNDEVIHVRLELRVSDLPRLILWQSEQTASDARDEEFLYFAQSLVYLRGANLDHWTREQRRDFLNWCLDEQVLTIKDGRLVPADIQETVPTAKLTTEEEGSHG